jgi:hypothetical protein
MGVYQKEDVYPGLERWTHHAGSEGYVFYCPGCNCHHMIHTNRQPGDNGPIWNRVGEASFTPSLICHGADRCHLYLTDGQIIYLPDCTHELAGKTVPLEDINHE